MSEAVSCSRDKCVGVVVVHGVGEAELGYAVNTLAYTLKDNFPDYSVTPHSEVLRLDEEETRRRPSRRPKRFRVVRRRVTHSSGTQLVFQELYWADLTNLAPGRLSALFGVFRTIFESHHFVDAMLDRKRDFGTAALRFLLLAASWLMRGPLAALTVSVAAVMALFVFGPVDKNSRLLGWFVEVSPYAKFMLAQCALAGIAMFAVFRVFRYKDVSWYDTTFWLGLAAAGLMVLAGTGSLPKVADALSFLRPKLEMKTCSDVFTSDCFINTPYLMIVAGWVAWYVIMTAAIALCALLCIRARARGDKKALAPLGASVGLIVLQFMLWTVVVVTALFPILSRGELVSALSVATDQQNRPVRDMLGGLKDDRRKLVAPLRELAQTPELVFPWIGPFKTVYALIAVAFIIAIFVMIGVMVRRWSMARRFDSGSQEAAVKIAPQDLPRLVFSPLLLVWLILSLSVLIYIILSDVQKILTDDSLRGALLGIASLLAVGAPFLLGHRIANLIHIARDLNDHLYKPSLETAYYFFPKVFRPLTRYPRRRRIQARLLEMLKNVIEDRPYDAVIFVAHSQGSIVVFDYLSQEQEPVELNDAAVAFLSMGSPIGHIYETYYHEYAEAALKIEKARSRVTTWVNLTRVDDYIGGHIAHERATEVENHVLARGGHTDYWNLREVAVALDDIVWRALAAGKARKAV